MSTRLRQSELKGRRVAILTLKGEPVGRITDGRPSLGAAAKAGPYGSTMSGAGSATVARYHITFTHGDQLGLWLTADEFKVLH